MDIIEKLGEDIPLLGITYMQVIAALLTLVLGFLAVKIIVMIIKAGLKKGKMPPLMRDFLGKFISAILFIIVLLFALGALGIQVGSIFIGVSAALGLVLAFGMQDTLNNMFAGIWLATLRPIRMEEVVEVAGMRGKVTGLNIMSTELNTPDNTYITIPNKQVWGSPIKNDTRMPIRRVDVDVGVAYGTDLSRAIRTAISVMKKNKMVMDDPAPDVVVTALADSYINLQLRAWCNTPDYWTLRGTLTKVMPQEYEKEGIEIPFPQMDVHMKEG